MGHNLDRTLNPADYDANGNPVGDQPGGLTQPMNAGGGGGPGKDLNVDPGVLSRGSGAAGEVMGALGKDGRIPNDTTQAAAKSLGQENFQLGGALKSTGELWYSQITTLHLACHKIEQNLDANAKGYRMVEDRNQLTMARIAQNFE